MFKGKKPLASDVNVSINYPGEKQFSLQKERKLPHSKDFRRRVRQLTLTAEQVGYTCLAMRREW